MRYLLLLFVVMLVGCSSSLVHKEARVESCPDRPEYAIVLHGGAGWISKKSVSAEKAKAFKEVMNRALDAGEKALKNGAPATEAVMAVITVMEDSPLFNAGKGAVSTAEGTHELDASIMDGSDLNAGAVGGVMTVKNPILAAYKVMTQSKHVFLTGQGADRFAKEQGLEIVPNTYFDKPEKKLKKTGSILKDEIHKFGTVGCVALDKKGHIAAGTSTGGMSGKKYNRIGDSPVIGAGTYANDKTCGVSCTGHGEYYIRWAVAHDASAQLEYTDRSLDEVLHNILFDKLKPSGGVGGIIAIDKCGNISMQYNTPGMLRAYAKPGERVVKVYD